MERSYRQYCVLDDQTLARVTIKPAAARYSQMLDAHAGVLRTKLWQALRQDVGDLAQLQCKNSGPDARAAARLEVFASNNSSMVQATRAGRLFSWPTAAAGDKPNAPSFQLAGAGAVSAEPGAGATHLA